MKRTLFTPVLMLTLLSTFYLSNTFAQDYTQWNLPEGAKARLGKGNIRDIKYSPDGKMLAVAGSIGIWLYDTENNYQETGLPYGTYGSGRERLVQSGW